MNSSSFHFIFNFFINATVDNLFIFNTGPDRGEPRSFNAAQGGPPQKVLPIETPAISLTELNRLTGNFCSKALIGEGSYGRVFHAKLSNGQDAAIKNLDTSSSLDSDTEFAAQVYIFTYIR